jgi:hypothetical protein
VITNRDRSTVLSSMGWVDGDAIWRFDAASGHAETIPIASGAQYLTLHAGDGDRFAVGHRADGSRFEVSVRSFVQPAVAIARAVVDAGGPRLEGDATAWRLVPRLFVPYLKLPPWNDFVLVRIDPAGGGVVIQELSWYDESYDKEYQGVIDVLALPDGRSALVSVQRSSRVILHDLVTGARRRAIDLGGRAGNPMLHDVPEAGEIWATDYDTLVVVRARDWSVRGHARLQDAAAGTQQFIGDIAFPPDGDLCVVARPFSGDAVAVDRATLTRRSSAPLGAQPLQVAALGSGEIVARDWKSGALLRGRLRA